MKTLATVTFALLLTIATSAGAYAQSESENARNSPSQPSNNPNSAAGTGAPKMDGETTGQAAPQDQPYVPSPSLDKQPPVATGVDLQGPPKEFPSNKTPE